MDRENKTEEQLALALESNRPQGDARGKSLPPAAMTEPHQHALLGAVVVVIVCLTVLFYGVFFWPGLYEVATIRTGDRIYPTRINRITGSVHYFDGETWRKTPVPSIGASDRVQTLPENVPLPERQETQKALPVIEKNQPFAVQIKALDNWLDANNMMMALKKTGADVHFVAVSMGDRGIWYRILLGHFRTFDEASAFMQANRLKDFFPDSFVQKVSP